MKVALYARVSRDDLHCENQTVVLKDWANKNLNDKDQRDFFTEDLSSRKTRPVKEAIIQGIRSGKYDTIVVTRIDRFARSLQELVGNIREIVDRGARFISIMNGFDFTKTHFNASQQLMLNIFASFAEFEREIIRERTLEGLARTSAAGQKLGRPKGSKNKPKLAPPAETRGGYPSQNTTARVTDDISKGDAS